MDGILLEASVDKNSKLRIPETYSGFEEVARHKVYPDDQNGAFEEIALYNDYEVIVSRNDELQEKALFVDPVLYLATKTIEEMFENM